LQELQEKYNREQAEYNILLQRFQNDSATKNSEVEALVQRKRELERELQEAELQLQRLQGVSFRESTERLAELRGQMVEVQNEFDRKNQEVKD